LSNWPEKIKKIPKQARAIERVEKILSISKLIVETEGVDALTTTKLSETADIPVGSIYQYFDCREDILEFLYANAYNEVLERVQYVLENADTKPDFQSLNKEIITVFWNTAKTHKSFNQLTRWANSSNTIWESTTHNNTQVPLIVEQVLNRSGMLPILSRRKAVITTLSTIISVLVDQAIENEEEAESLIDELRILLEAYVGTLKQQ
jgi:AcrR family transcriptional regulator